MHVYIYTYVLCIYRCIVYIYGYGMVHNDRPQHFDDLDMTSLLGRFGTSLYIPHVATIGDRHSAGIFTDQHVQSPRRGNLLVSTVKVQRDIDKGITILLG